jgi:hypothetical protein
LSKLLSGGSLFRTLKVLVNNFSDIHRAVASVFTSTDPGITVNRFVFH